MFLSLMFFVLDNTVQRNFQWQVPWISTHCRWYPPSPAWRSSPSCPHTPSTHHSYSHSYRRRYSPSYRHRYRLRYRWEGQAQIQPQLPPQIQVMSLSSHRYSSSWREYCTAPRTYGRRITRMFPVPRCRPRPSKKWWRRPWSFHMR